MLFGTDSHTCNAGAFGQFATGVGNTDAGFILGTGKLLIKVIVCVWVLGVLECRVKPLCFGEVGRLVRKKRVASWQATDEGQLRSRLGLSNTSHPFEIFCKQHCNLQATAVLC